MRILLFFALFMGCIQSMNAQAIFLRDEINNGEFVLNVKNNLPCPSVITAKPDSMDKKFQQFLPKDSERILIRLPIDSLKNEKKFKGQLRYNLVVGNPNAIPDPSYQYLLPYPNGESHRLIQGNNSSFTHNDPESRFAFDFKMAEGNIVSAVRGGVVGFVRDNSRENGTDEAFMRKGNQILVCHDDGTVAIYAHLKHKGALVEIGDDVFAGQAIGLSGNTGFSTTPHLHFVVMVGARSIPVRFRNLPDSLIQGLSYRQNLNFSEQLNR